MQAAFNFMLKHYSDLILKRLILAKRRCKYIFYTDICQSRMESFNFRRLDYKIFSEFQNLPKNHKETRKILFTQVFNQIGFICLLKFKK